MEVELMMMNTFFVCPHCGNDKEFKVFTSCYQAVKQSPELGKRIAESDVLPNLRHNDNYIECQLCLKRHEYESASATGKKYAQSLQRLHTRTGRNWENPRYQNTNSK